VIGAGFIPAVLNINLIDQIIAVDDNDTIDQGKRILAVAPDGVDMYMLN
jgi:cysteine synthase